MVRSPEVPLVRNSFEEDRGYYDRPVTLETREVFRSTAGGNPGYPSDRLKFEGAGNNYLDYRGTSKY